MIIKIGIDNMYRLDSFFRIYVGNSNDKFAVIGQLGHEASVCRVIAEFVHKHEALVCLNSIISDYERGNRVFDVEAYLCKSTENRVESEVEPEMSDAEKLEVCRAALSDSTAREKKLEAENRQLTLELFEANALIKRSMTFLK